MMLRTIACAALSMLGLTMGPAIAQTTTVRVGWCAKTVSSAAAPFAIATKMGWFEKDGINVNLVPLPGSGDCVKLTATREFPFSLPSAEPLAIIRQQGVKAKFFYTAYQANIYGIAVPADSPIKTMADLKGKKIGVISMAAASVVVARALAKQAGLDPDKDINIVVAGEGAQTAALINSKQIEALSQFDTQYALVESAGVKLRYLEHPEIRNFPSNGFIALDETLVEKRKEAIALARGYAMGTVFAMVNPEAAVRILWEIYPFTRATGKDEATALKDDVKTLEARAKNWKYQPVGAKRWGDSVEQNYQGYMDWLFAQAIIKQPASAKEMVTNDLLDDINKFDEKAIIAIAEAYKVK